MLWRHRRHQCCQHTSSQEEQDQGSLPEEQIKSVEGHLAGQHTVCYC